jgi:hypothetical protein
MSTIRKLALVVLAAALAAGAGLLYWQSRTETGYLARRPLARYERIAAEDLVPVALSRQRPAEFRVVTDAAGLAGGYAAQEIPAGTLFSPALVVDRPPELRVFAGGEELPAGLRGYPLTIATDLAPLLRADDLVDLVLVNPREGTATWLLGNVRPLYSVAADGPTTMYLLALAPEQVALVEGALADARTDQSGAYAKLVLSQPKNPPLEPLTVYDYRALRR